MESCTGNDIILVEADISSTASCTYIHDPHENFIKNVNLLQEKINKYPEAKWKDFGDLADVKINSNQAQKDRAYPILNGISRYIEIMGHFNLDKANYKSAQKYFYDLKILHDEAISLFENLRYPLTESQLMIGALFDIAFNVMKNDILPFRYEMKISPIFSQMSRILNKDASEKICSIWAGKSSRAYDCFPVILCVKAYRELSLISSSEKYVRYPFIFVIQNSSTITELKKTSYMTRLGDLVRVSNSIPEIIELLNQENHKKPILCILSAIDVISVILKSQNDIFKVSRFCFEDFSTPSVLESVLFTIITNNIKNEETIPLLLSVISNREVDLSSFGPTININMHYQRCFVIKKREYSASSQKESAEKCDEAIKEAIKMISKRKLSKGTIVSYYPQISTDTISSLTKKINELNEDTEHDIEIVVLDEVFRQGESAANFEKRIQLELTEKKQKGVLYILPIFITKSFNPQVMEFASRKSSLMNTVKLVCTTKFIFSSKDYVSAVIDGGYYNETVTNISDDIKTEEIVPVTMQVHKIRTYQLGEYQPGLDVLISKEGSEIKDAVDPEIETGDLTNPALALRAIGIKIEDINNIPAEGRIKEAINTLQGIGAIDTDGNLTEKGREISLLTGIPRFMSLSVLSNASVNYGGNKYAAAAGVLASTIMISDYIVSYPSSKLMIECFDEESDIVTLMRVFFKLVGKSKEEVHLGGFSTKAYGIIYNNISEYLMTKEIDDEIGKIEEFLGDSIKEFIDNLLKEINTINPKWLVARKGKYRTIDKITTTPTYQMKIKTVDVIIKSRPGQIGPHIPAISFIFNLSKAGNSYEGKLIHKTWENQEKELRCVSRKCPISFSTEFTMPILDVYIGKASGVVKFELSKKKSVPAFSKVLDNETAVITYNLSNENSVKVFDEAIEVIGKLLPYIPRSIIVHNQTPFCVVELFSMGGYRTGSLLHFFSGHGAKPPHPYEINRNTINAAINMYKDALEEVQPTVRFAITGESLSFSLDEEHDETALAPPTVESPLGSVFGGQASHMVMLVEDGLPLVPDEKELEWYSEGFQKEMTEDQIVMGKANSIFPGVIMFRKPVTCFLVKQNSDPIILEEGSFSTLKEIAEHYKKKHLCEEKLIYPITEGNIFKELQKQEKSTSSSKPRPPPAPKIHEQELQMLKEEQKKLIKVKKELNDEYNKNHEDKNWRKKKFTDFKNRQAANNEAIKEINSKIEEIRKVIKEKNDASSVSSQASQNSHASKTGQKAKKEPQPKTKPGKESDQVDGGNKKTNIKISIDNLVGKDANIFFMKKYKGLYYLLASNLRPENVEVVKEKIKSALIENNETVSSIEAYDFVNVSINHRYTSSLSPDELMLKVKNITSKYGLALNKCSAYKPIGVDAKKYFRMNYQGQIDFSFLSIDFAIACMTEIRDAIIGSTSVILRIPQSVLHPTIARKEECLSAILEWAKERNIGINREGYQFRGSEEEVHRAISLMMNANTRPNIPLTTINVGKTFDINRLMKELKVLKVKEYSFNTQIRTIIAKSESADIIRNAIKEMRSDDTDILDCDMCDNPEASSEAVIVFSKGKATRSCFCLDCVTKMLEFATSRFFDPSTGTDFRRLMENILPVDDITFSNVFARTNSFYNETPLGMFVYSMVREQSIMALAKTWVNGKVMATLRANPQLVSFCPDHPNQILAIPPVGNLYCAHEGCQNKLCFICGKWHTGACPKDDFIWQFAKPCPYCHFPVEKASGCNRIICRCGKIWCYKCAKVYFENNQIYDCYNHMRAQHGGIYD